MATVREALTRASLVEVNGGELESIGTVYRPEGVARIMASALGIPPDTENTPHAIAAAVLGIDEDTLRRRLDHVCPLDIKTPDDETTLDWEDDR